MNFDYKITFTEAPLDAIELAETAASDHDVVVAVGGDGTANEVLNGIVRANQKAPDRPTSMGLIPIGQGNDFGFGVGIPLDTQAACNLLQSGFRKTIDVGSVRGGDFPQGRFFGNSVGIGFDAVVGFVALRQKPLHGFPSYLLATLKTMFLYYKAPKVRIQFGDQESIQQTLMVSIMNGRRLGGGFMMAPDAIMDDGIFDLCIVDQVSRFRIATLIPHFLKGTQASQEPVATAKSERISITALEGSLPAHADGETLCTDGAKLEIEILPRALDIIAPSPPL
jgi:YegS/Rv2252/BmrU family lipid kinase